LREAAEAFGVKWAAQSGGFKNKDQLCQDILLAIKHIPGVDNVQTRALLRQGIYKAGSDCQVGVLHGEHLDGLSPTPGKEVQVSSTDKLPSQGRAEEADAEGIERPGIDIAVYSAGLAALTAEPLATRSDQQISEGALEVLPSRHWKYWPGRTIKILGGAGQRLWSTLVIIDNNHIEMFSHINNTNLVTVLALQLAPAQACRGSSASRPVIWGSHRLRHTDAFYKIARHGQ